MPMAAHRRAFADSRIEKLHWLGTVGAPVVSVLAHGR
jgi:hypothetical protein